MDDVKISLSEIFGLEEFIFWDISVYKEDDGNYFVVVRRDLMDYEIEQVKTLMRNVREQNNG